MATFYHLRPFDVQSATTGRWQGADKGILCPVYKEYLAFIQVKGGKVRRSKGPSISNINPPILLSALLGTKKKCNFRAKALKQFTLIHWVTVWIQNSTSEPNNASFHNSLFNRKCWKKSAAKCSCYCTWSQGWDLKLLLSCYYVCNHIWCRKSFDYRSYLTKPFLRKWNQFFKS